MKECLVIALVLSLTGTVVGQQSGTRTEFDTSRTDSTRVLGSSALGNASGSTADPVDRIMKLDIDAAMIEAIKLGETLEASIDLKDVTSGIVMFFDDPTTIKPRVDEVPRNLKPDYSSGNGVLHFTIDEVGLERLKTEGLQYTYNPDEKGTYEKVSLTFVSSDPSSRRLSDADSIKSSVSHSQDGRFGSPHSDSERLDSTTRDYRAQTLGRETHSDSLHRNDFNSSISRPDRDFTSDSTQSAADRYLEHQRAMERQRKLDRQRQLAEDREHFLNRSLHDRNRLRRDLDTNWSSTRSKTLTPDDRNTHQFELTDQEIDALAMSTQQIRDQRLEHEAELERLRLDKLASKREVERVNADRLRLVKELRDRDSLDQSPIAKRRSLDEDEFYKSYSQRTLLPASDRLARAGEFDHRFDLQLDRQRDQTIATDSQQLRLQEATLENERLRLRLARAHKDKENLADHYERRLNNLDNLGNSLVDNSVHRSPLRMSDFGASIPGTQNRQQNQTTRTNVPETVTAVSGTHLTATAVDHILRSYNGSNFEQVANRVKGEVAALTTAKNRVDKFNGFLLFLFITFFALSLYLGWLAQSFYGQYGELADELRETFTATV